MVAVYTKQTVSCFNNLSHDGHAIIWNCQKKCLNLMTVEKWTLLKMKSIATKYWYWHYFSTAVLVLAILYCQSIVIGIDNSFHEKC